MRWWEELQAECSEQWQRENPPPKRNVYITDFGEVILPQDPPLGCFDGWATNRYFAYGPYAKYLDFVEALARGAWERKGRLKIAPPFTAWYAWNRLCGHI